MVKVLDLRKPKILKKISNLLSVWVSIISIPPKAFLQKLVLKICSKFTGEHPCRSAISIKLQNSFIEIGIWHVCCPVNWLHIFRTSFYRNTSVGLLLLNVSFKVTYSRFLSNKSFSKTSQMYNFKEDVPGIYKVFLKGKRS